MNRIFAILLFLISGFCNAQTLTQMRCYFDGNEAEVQYFMLGGVEEINSPFDIDVSTLSKGVHQLYVEVLDNNNRWSLYDLKTIQVIGGLQMATLNKLEYFFDTDPGFGNGIQLAISGNVYEAQLELDISGLAPGLHMVYLRASDGAGQWSQYASHLLQVVASGYVEITAAEYFFDSDPGFGNGVQIPLSDFTVDSDLNLSLVGVSQGVHQLYIRVRDESGQWSLYAHSVIQAEGGVGYNEVVGAEYFFDVDPGFGNGLPIAISPGFSFDDNFDIDVPEDLSLGAHVIYVRVKDGADQWSMYAHDTIDVCDIIVPTIALSGDICEGNIQTLTVNETFNSYFWNTEDTTSNIDVSESGVYSVTVNDEDCSISVSTEVVFIEMPEPTIGQDGNTLVCDQEGFQYQWYFNGEIIDGATSQSYAALVDGNYTVAIYQESCEAISPAYGFVYNGIEVFLGAGFKVYPNPANGKVYLQYMSTGPAEIEMHDATGRLVLSIPVITNEINIEKNGEIPNRIEIDTSNLLNGFYHVTLTIQNEVYRQSIIVAH